MPVEGALPATAGAAVSPAKATTATTTTLSPNCSGRVNMRGVRCVWFMTIRDGEGPGVSESIVEPGSAPSQMREGSRDASRRWNPAERARGLPTDVRPPRLEVAVRRPPCRQHLPGDPCRGRAGCRRRGHPDGLPFDREPRSTRGCAPDAESSGAGRVGPRSMARFSCSRRGNPARAASPMHHGGRPGVLDEERGCSRCRRRRVDQTSVVTRRPRAASRRGSCRRRATSIWSSTLRGSGSSVDLAGSRGRGSAASSATVGRSPRSPA